MYGNLVMTLRRKKMGIEAALLNLGLSALADITLGEHL
jgi:hypothetical protein